MPKNGLARNQRRRRVRKRSSPYRTTRQPQNSVTGHSATNSGLPSVGSVLLRRPAIFPASARVRLVYYEPDINMTMPANGNAINYVYSANGCFDPNITGTGIQATGFDQMCLFYDQYTVVASEIEVNFSPQCPAICAISLKDDSSVDTSSQKIVGNGLMRKALYTGQSAIRPQANSTCNVRVPPLSLQCDVAAVLGRPRGLGIINDVTLSGTAAANPTEQQYYHISAWQFAIDGATAKDVDFEVTIVFDVVFWEPKRLANS
jgi:hypothetical protein